MVPASVNLVTRATPARKVSALSQYAALRCYYCIDVYIITDGFIQTFWTNINKDIWYICRHAVRQRKGKKLFARKVNRYHFQSSFPEYVDVRNLWYNQLRFTKCSLNEDRKSMSHSLKWTRLVPVCSSYIWVLCPVLSLECNPGTYGAGCEKKCVCPPGVSCDHVTGECQRKCPPGRHGENCDQGMWL